jgi:O-antigen polymerase
MFPEYLFSNQSIVGIFDAILLVFFIPLLIGCKSKIRLGLLPVILLLSVALILSNSRSGWLGCVTGLIYIVYQHIYIRNRKIFIWIASFFLIIFFLSILFYKPDSSTGRKHIYNISLGMLRDNWVHGIGLGKFKAKFNEYQADYFSLNDIDSKRALLADNTFYAFNDYLQWVIETGLIGLVILLTAMYFTIRRVINLHNENPNKPVFVSATASLICVAVAALFSYPLQVISIQALVLICLGILAFYPESKRGVSKPQKLNNFFYRLLIIILIAAFVNKAWNEVNRKRLEKHAFELARSGYKTEAINKYKGLVEEYPANGVNWFLYAQKLYYANRLTDAYESLNKGMMYYVDNKVYKLKADIEQELNMYTKAEKSYLRAIYMVPNRMASRLDLLNFYMARRDTIKTVYWANSILNMPVKVVAERTSNMLKTTKEILSKIQN